MAPEKNLPTPRLFSTHFKAAALQQKEVCGKIKNRLRDRSEASGYFMMPRRFQRPCNEKWAQCYITGSSSLQHSRKIEAENRREENSQAEEAGGHSVFRPGTDRADCQLITHQRTWNDPRTSICLTHTWIHPSLHSLSLFLSYLTISYVPLKSLKHWSDSQQEGRTFCLACVQWRHILSLLTKYLSIPSRTKSCWQVKHNLAQHDATLFTPFVRRRLQYDLKNEVTWWI